MPLNGQAPPFNLLLDPLPDSYAGYLIRTDYRIGVQISLCLQDEDLTQEERVSQAVWLLFGSGAPPVTYSEDERAAIAEFFSGAEA